MLRQEVYALDDKDKERSNRPYSVSERNYAIKPVQPLGANRHSIFFTHALETIDFYYERKLFPVVNGQIVDAAAAQSAGVTWRADPRVSHAAVLDVDDYGNVRQSVAIGYGRRFDDLNPVLTDADRRKQKQLSVTLTDASFTNAVVAVDAYRAPLPAEVHTYELLKLRPAAQQADITNLFRFKELVALVSQAGDGVHDLLYEDVNATRAMGAGPYRRPIEQVRTRYRSNNLGQLLPLQTLQALAVPGESYRLAFTPGLLSTVYQRPHAPQATENLLPNPGSVLLADATQPSDRGGYVDLDADGRWWTPSGRAFFHPGETASVQDEMSEAASHFFLPRRFRDPFAQSTLVDYVNDLFPARTRDALGNMVEAVYDFRVLQAKQLTDPNGNRSFAAFDAFGLPVATAVCGKISETLGDSLDDFGDFDADPSLAQLRGFVALPRVQASSLLRGASSRVAYDLDRFRRCGEPPFAATLTRETHVSDLLPGQALQIQVSFTYSDGFGRELQSKIPAEPGRRTPAPATWLCRAAISVQVRCTRRQRCACLGDREPSLGRQGPDGLQQQGQTGQAVRAILQQHPPVRSGTGDDRYRRHADLVLRPGRTRRRDASSESHLREGRVRSVAAGDLGRERHGHANPIRRPIRMSGRSFSCCPLLTTCPTWHDAATQRRKGTRRESAQRTRLPRTPHTPTVPTSTRSVGLPDGRRQRQMPAARYRSTPTRVSWTSKAISARSIDAKDRIVMHYDYDMLGNRIHQSSMEAGERWMLNDVTGKPIRAWDSRDHGLRTEYDELRRPLRSFVIGADAQNPAREICFEQTVYGESPAAASLPAKSCKPTCAASPTSTTTPPASSPARRTTSRATCCAARGNWCGTTRPHRIGRRAHSPFSKPRSSPAAPAMTRSIGRSRWSRRTATSRRQINVIRPGYNEANLLERVDVWLGQAAEPADLLDPPSATLHAVTNIDYDAKGQRTRIALRQRRADRLHL